MSHIPPKDVIAQVHKMSDDMNIPMAECRITYYEIYDMVKNHNKAIGILRDRLLLKYLLPRW